MNDELILRKQAVNLFLKGKAKKDIAQILGKSRQWVHKWIKRYHAIGGETWYLSCCTAPKTIRKKTSSDIEKLVISIRKGLDSKLYAQKGALNILYELNRMGVAPPSIATINRILKRNRLISKDSLRFAKKKSTQVILL